MCRSLTEFLCSPVSFLFHLSFFFGINVQRLMLNDSECHLEHEMTELKPYAYVYITYKNNNQI
ncbi:hypothetical protein BDZ91DRAFT_725770 [Kalaharituber pfeilii]|nr:hypothetical protein BDZ91DRAFT_725770 [Kalaharituber pfeilii]